MVLNEEDFANYDALRSIVQKLNKYINKNNPEKIKKFIGQLKDLLEQNRETIPITFILSVIAEHDISLISEDIITETEKFLESGDNKVIANALIVIGFYLVNEVPFNEALFSKFLSFLTHEDKDVRENLYYFFSPIIERESTMIAKYKDVFIKSLSIEQNEKNLVSILNYLKMAGEYNFEQLWNLRVILKQLSHRTDLKENPDISGNVQNLVTNVYLNIKIGDGKYLNLKELIRLLDQHCIMTRTEFQENQKLKMKERLDYLKDCDLRDQILYIYIFDKEEKRYVLYEVEKVKFLENFTQKVISSEELINIFSPIIKGSPEMDLLIRSLQKLNYLKGYYSELGYFYPFNYLREQFIAVLSEKGSINLKKFNYLPSYIIQKLLNDITESTNQELLADKEGKKLYSMKKILEQIKREAARISAIDLKAFETRISSESFDKLIKSMPEEYLTKFRRGNRWLTNLGLLNIKTNLERSKMLGYVSVPRISESLSIPKDLIKDVLETLLDKRSGLFDKDNEIFYYAKFVNDKIERISAIQDPTERQSEVNILARELNIDKNDILKNIDENVRLIGEEIKQKDQIDVDLYLDKTGMSYNAFINFIEDLGLNYFKKGKVLIISDSKINEAKKEIKEILIETSQKQNFIMIHSMEITPSIVKALIDELIDQKLMEGIFYQDDDGLKFYTILGIENLMLDNNYLFSFEDLFPNAPLTQSQIETLKSILNELIKRKRLNGSFDEESLTFSSSDVLFAQNYNTVVYNFESIVESINETFGSEFDKVRKILIKENQTIFPQEIKLIQETIEKMNENIIRWRNELDAFVRRGNSELLRKQGIKRSSLRNKALNFDKKEEIKIFEDDTQVKERLSEFNSWVKAFNELELKYGNIIFYQKRLITNPDNEENKQKFYELCKQLNLF